MASSSPKCCKDTIARSSDSFDFVYFRSIVNVMSNSDEKYDDDTDGRMLFDAIRKGKQHLVRFILEAAPGNIVNARDFNGKTALIVVSSIKVSSQLKMTKYFIYLCHYFSINDTAKGTCFLKRNIGISL